MSDPRPIGVFDSGVGGLTVLRALHAHFPQENFLYLGDTARLPYGSKSPETIRRYSEQNVRFLAQQGVKAVVIACNSASTQMNEAEFEGLPLFNVIEPGARAALKASPQSRIGLIGTRATIASGAYERALRRHQPEVEVFSQACPLMVPLAEEGWDGDPVTNLIVFRYLQVLLEKNIDSLILGCTHYPLLEGSISRVTGSAIPLIDSGQALAEDLKLALTQGRVQAKSEGAGQLDFLLTDPTGLFEDLAKRILGPLARKPQSVDLSIAK